MAINNLFKQISEQTTFSPDIQKRFMDHIEDESKQALELRADLYQKIKFVVMVEFITACLFVLCTGFEKRIVLVFITVICGGTIVTINIMAKYLFQTKS